MIFAIYYTVLLLVVFFAGYGLYDVSKQTRDIKDKLDNPDNDGRETN